MSQQKHQNKNAAKPASSKKKNTKKKTNTKAKSKSRSSVKRKVNTKISPKTVFIFIICLAAIAGMIAAAVALGSGGHRPSGVKAPDKDIAWGIDVSSHNGEIDWETVKDGADFAFIRVGYRGFTEGEINVDKRYKENLKEANKCGIPVGVYFYSQAITPEEAEYEALFMLERIKGYDISLPVVIDFEYAYRGGQHTGRLWEAELSKRDKTNLINTFCDTVREAGYTPGVYASTYVFESLLNTKAIPEDVFIWVADYNSDITYNGYYDIWQYSETGSCDGVHSNNVDTDYWYIKNRL